MMLLSVNSVLVPSYSEAGVHTVREAVISSERPFIRTMLLFARDEGATYWKVFSPFERKECLWTF